MNYIRHLNAFFTHIKNDQRITSSHVSLYMALFQYWNFNRFENPFRIYRENIMQLSKIGSKNTYHKCIKDLHLAKYIYYQPGAAKNQPGKISVIRLDKNEEKRPEQLDLFSIDFGTRTDPKKSTHTTPENDDKRVPDLTEPCLNNETQPVPILTDSCPDNGTERVPNVGRIIKQVNYKQSNSVLNSNTPTEIFKKNEAINQKINGLAAVPNLGHAGNPPTSPLPTCGEGPGVGALPQIESFFLENGHPITEAQKFFYYNQSKNWMLTDTIPITDWKSIAHKWMLNNKQNKNIHHVKSGTSQHDLSSGNDKDYSEPL